MDKSHSKKELSSPRRASGAPPRWVVEEMRDLDLADRRLDKRVVRVVSDLGERPTASIPAACGGWKETAAAYRLFDNEAATLEAILRPHHERTLERMAAHPLVLLVQDTTEIDLTRPQQQVKGAGLLDDSSRQGALLHLMQAFTPDGTPLGSLWAKAWMRTEGTASARGRKRKALPIEEKESHRWIEGLQQARHAAQQKLATRCLCIADSEADIYELFVEPRGGAPEQPEAFRVEWLVRACQPRALVKSGNLRPAVAGAPTGADPANFDAAFEHAPVLFTKDIEVRGREAKVSCETRGRRQPRESRCTEVEVRALSVTLRPPYRCGKRLPAVRVNAVRVREIATPQGDIPVEWLLLTTLPIDTIEQVQQIVDYYSTRFLIEVLFRVLKGGCRVEKRRFEDVERLLPCLAVYLIVAWRTFLLCRIGRKHPRLSCEACFAPEEWQPVWSITQGKALPRRPPPLQEMIVLIAQLGGYVRRGRKPQLPPGPQTLWLGLQRVRDLALAWKTFGPKSYV